MATLRLPSLLAQYIIDLPVVVFIVLGAGLLLIAVGVCLTARIPSPSRTSVLTIFSADLAWVILTPIVMLLLSDRITQLGNIILLDIAVIVAAFAAFEWIGMGRLHPSKQ